MFVNRGIYHKGWTAVTRHSIPWKPTEMPAFTTTTSGSCTRRTTGPRPTTCPPSKPEKLHELQRLFLIEAARYNVLPLDDRRFERFNADIAGRPQLSRASRSCCTRAWAGCRENSVLVIKNKSHAVTAEIEVPEGGAEGVIVAQGGAYAGWSLYLHEGRPAYCYNFFGLQRFKVHGEQPVPPGEHQVRMEFAYDGGGLAKGGDVTLYVDGDQVGDGRVEHTVPMVFSGTRRPTWAATAPPGQRRPRHRQRLHRPGPMGPDRHRRGRRGRGPPDQPGGAPAGGDGAPVRWGSPTPGGRTLSTRTR